MGQFQVKKRDQIKLDLEDQFEFDERGAKVTGFSNFKNTFRILKAKMNEFTAVIGTIRQ